MEWQFLAGDVDWPTHGGTFVSERQAPTGNPREMEYWITIEVTPINDEGFARSLGYEERKDEDGFYLSATEGDNGEALVYIQAFIVRPQVAKKEILAARQSWGMSDEEYEERRKPDGRHVNYLLDVELLHSYGIRAPLSVVLHGYDAEQLLEDAKREAEFLGGTLFGFQMDRQCNAVGATGWDLLKGNVLGKLE